MFITRIKKMKMEKIKDEDVTWSPANSWLLSVTTAEALFDEGSAYEWRLSCGSLDNMPRHPESWGSRL